MKNNKFFFKIFLIFIFFQVNTKAISVENKIIAKVGAQIISSYELKNKIKTILFLTKQELTQKNINFAKEQAIRSLVDHKIKTQELSNYNVKIINNSKSNIFVKNVSIRYDTTIPGLKKIFSENDLDFGIYENELLVEFFWQKLIYNIYKNKINLNEKELEKELNLIVNEQKSIKEYQLGEIEIPYLNNSKDEENIKNIYAQIQELGFKEAAIKFSSSTSAFNGGDLGWISSNSLSSKIFQVIQKMNVGNISKPIKQTNTFMILKLLDERMIDAEKINLDDMRKKIVESKKNEVLGLFSKNHLSKLKNTTLIKIQ